MHYICEPGLFQCSCGACVANETDCRLIKKDDDSDRLTFGPCRISDSEIPKKGFVEHFDVSGVHLKVNHMIPDFEKVRLSCIEKHRIVGNDTIVCRDGIWDGDVPACEPFCAPIVFTYRFFAICHLNKAEVDCMEHAKRGTIATIYCRWGYESAESEQQTICGLDGRWQPEPMACKQICGVRMRRTDETATENESNAIQAPWHVTIYKRASLDHPFEHICGGTILSAWMVLSATHCFWDESLNETYDYEHLSQIKTGKSSREYDDNVETGIVQTFGVYNVIRDMFYTGIKGFYEGDIALVMLSDIIEFNPYTLPICYDDQLEEEEQYVSPDLEGVLGGWGVDKASGKLSSTLNLFELSVISLEKCKSESTEEFLAFLTGDKFCVLSFSCAMMIVAVDWYFPLKKMAK